MSELQLNTTPDDNIRVVKTMDGIDYIGEYTEALGKVYIRKCLGVFVQEDPQNRGSFQVGFMPAVHPAVGIIDEDSRGAADLDMQATAIKFTHFPHPEMHKMYKQAVSGIEIAKIMPGKL